VAIFSPASDALSIEVVLYKKKVYYALPGLRGEVLLVSKEEPEPSEGKV